MPKLYEVPEDAEPVLTVHAGPGLLRAEPKNLTLYRMNTPDGAPCGLVVLDAVTSRVAYAPLNGEGIDNTGLGALRRVLALLRAPDVTRFLHCGATEDMQLGNKAVSDVVVDLFACLEALKRFET